MFPLSLPSTLTDVTSLRMLLHSGDRQYLCHGVYATGISLAGFGPREVPRIDIDWACAWWETSAATFPSAVSASAKTPAPNAGGGSFFLNDEATSQLFTCLGFGLAIEGGAMPLETSCTDRTDSIIANARHSPLIGTVSATVDYDAALFAHYEAGDQMRMSYTLNPIPGKALGVYCPALEWAAEPQMVDMNGRNTVSISLRATPTSTTTSDQTLAPFHLMMG